MPASHRMGNGCLLFSARDSVSIRHMLSER